MNLAAVCKSWQTQVLPSLCSPPGKVIPCGMSLLPHGKWLLGGPWSCFDATGTSFKCGWASGSCCSAGRHSNQANKIFLSYLEGLSVCGVFGASHQPCSGGAQMDIGEQKGPAWELKGAGTAPGWGRLVWWGSGTGLVVQEQGGGLWLQQLSPVLCSVLCSVLRAGDFKAAKVWAETFISLST